MQTETTQYSYMQSNIIIYYGLRDYNQCLTKKLMASYYIYKLFLEGKAGIVKYKNFRVLKFKS